MTVTELGDADGHIIEPGNLWAERMPKDLRDMAPRWFRDEQGVFHQEIYGLDISTLEVMQGGMRPRDMLQNMGLAAAMGQDLGRVFSEDERDRYTMLDAPDWTRDGKKRLEFNLAHGVGRACSFRRSCSPAARSSRTSPPPAPSTTTGSSTTTAVARADG
jgi:hypothetical protein